MFRGWIQPLGGSPDGGFAVDGVCLVCLGVRMELGWCDTAVGELGDYGVDGGGRAVASERAVAFCFLVLFMDGYGSGGGNLERMVWARNFSGCGINNGADFGWGRNGTDCVENR